MIVKLGLLVVPLVLMMSGCASRDTEPPQAPDADEIPARIVINAPGSLPEGVEYDTKHRRFLVGSLSRGTVFEVGKDGALIPFAQDPDLKSSVGIEVDEKRDRLLVVNADIGVFKDESASRAMLGIYDLGSGRRTAMIDLSVAGPKTAKKRFANDVAVGTDGSVYITDTLARLVYKVAPDNTVSALQAENIAADKPLGLNGIECHPSGYLLVGDFAAGDLYKVSLSEPNSFVRVALPEPLSGADGIVLHPDGTLYVVRFGSNSVVGLRSSDDWASATIVGRGVFEVQATTAAAVGNEIYVVHPQFDVARFPEANAEALPFIERVKIQ